MSAFRRVLFVAVATAVFGWPVTGTAYAHTRLVDSVPRDGTVLGVGPARVSFTFDQELQDFGHLCTITVTGPGGSSWPTGPVSIAGHTVSAAVGDVGPEGRYEVSYLVLAADSHPVSGRIAITVSHPADGAARIGLRGPARGDGWVAAAAAPLALGLGFWRVRRWRRGNR